MTTLIVTAQRIVPQIGIKNRIARMEEVFLAMNARGFLTGALLGLMVVGVAGYVALVAYSFNLGMYLRTVGTSAVGEDRAVKNLAVVVHEREANFSAEHQAALGEMDVVSSVSYLQADSVAIR